MSFRLFLTTTGAAFLGILGAAAMAAAPPSGVFAPGAGNKPMFTVIKRLTPNVHTLAPSAGLPEFTASYTYGGKTYNPLFVGAAPSSNTTTTIPVYIIPLKLTYGSTSFGALDTLPTGGTVVQSIVNSPLFQSSVDYVQGGTDLGKTQYIDAFQRATLWGQVTTYPNWHTILGTPTVEPLQTMTIPSRDGSITTNSGSTTIQAYINWLDPKLTALLTTLNIPANSLPIFVAYQTYLTQSARSGCCIGGYHSITSGGLPYSFTSYIKNVGQFAQDVSALSHELGEWADDPATNNTVPAACGTGAILEVGDPLEGNANYGGYPYTTNGFTYNLQDLTLLTYFGAPSTTSVNGWTTFQGENLPFCSNGG